MRENDTEYVTSNTVRIDPYVCYIPTSRIVRNRQKHTRFLNKSSRRKGVRVSLRKADLVSSTARFARVSNVVCASASPSS